MKQCNPVKLINCLFFFFVTETQISVRQTQKMFTDIYNEMNILGFFQINIFLFIPLKPIIKIFLK